MTTKPARESLVLACVFFRTSSGAQPVRDWLKDDIAEGARKTIGADLKTVQTTWPIGRPLVGSLGDGLWEVRSTYEKVEYRTVFYLDGSTMVLVHGFQKRTQRTPTRDLDLARQRKAEAERAR
ncbi:MAG: type II toxin-antitoxin system RelE/ParE family toxin [Polyangiales bacterium]